MVFRHWDEFYSRSDLEDLANTGISHVRIPVGYWLVDVIPGEPFPDPPATDNDGMRFYLKRIIGWCDELGLKVLIDLHGAPESQNGFDNSGRRGPADWYTTDGDETNVNRTYVILDKLSQLISSWILDGTMADTTLAGIAMLNEPAAWDENLWAELRDRFHYGAYDTIRATLFDYVKHKVVIQQAFRDPSDFIGYMTESEGYFGVQLDLHNYHAFGSYWNDLAGQPQGWSVNLQEACDFPNYVGSQTLGEIFICAVYFDP